MKWIWLIFFLDVMLVCSLDYCPEQCFCSFETEKLLLINCSSAGLDTFPSIKNLLDFDFYKLSQRMTPGSSMDINLSRNSITRASFPSSLEAVKKIDLSDNEIASMKHVNIENLKTLQELDLSHNPSLQTVTTDLKSKSLEILVISHCSISNLENGFLANVPSVRLLDISHNFVADLSALEPLRLEDAVDDVGRLNRSGPRLTHLNVSHNNLGTINGKHLRDTKLKIFDVSDNNLVNTSFTVYLRHLKYLNVSKNSLQSLGDMTLLSVIVLDLSRNKLRDISFDFSKKSPKLKILKASHNQIEELTEIKSFTIQDLDLSFCRIHNIKPNAFTWLGDLERLNLVGNRLNVLDYNALLAHKTLQFLFIQHNPWNCDCNSEEFRAFHSYALSKSNRSDNNLRCQNLNLTWSMACRNRPRGEELVMSKRRAFYTLLCIVAALLAMLALFYFYKCFRYMRQNASILRLCPEIELTDNGSQVVVSPNSYSEIHGSFQMSPRSSTPPPNYEEALLLPQLTEENKKKAMSSLSLNEATQGKGKAIPFS